MIDYPINRGWSAKRPLELVERGAQVVRDCGHHPGDQCDRRFPDGGFHLDAWFVAHTTQES